MAAWPSKRVQVDASKCVDGDEGGVEPRGGAWLVKVLGICAKEAVPLDPRYDGV